MDDSNPSQRTHRRTTLVDLGPYTDSPERLVGTAVALSIVASCCWTVNVNVTVNEAVLEWEQ